MVSLVETLPIPVPLQVPQGYLMVYPDPLHLVQAI